VTGNSAFNGWNIQWWLVRSNKVCGKLCSFICNFDLLVQFPSILIFPHVFKLSIIYFFTMLLPCILVMRHNICCLADGNFPILLTNCVVCFLTEQIFGPLFIIIHPQGSLRQHLLSLHLLLDQHYLIRAYIISFAVFQNLVRPMQFQSLTVALHQPNDTF
jgi:hypothetical protein